MNFQTAISLFTKSNYKFLTSPSFDKFEYKKRFTAFFVDQHQKKFGLPSNKEVQKDLLLLLRQTGVPLIDIKATIDTAPFFADISASTKEEFYSIAIAKEYSSVLPESELAKINRLGAYNALEHSKGKEIEERKQKELEAINKQIDAKKQEYDSLPSVLDHEPVEEPDFKPVNEDTQPWWERFYLKSDPFPRKDGLSEISAEMYEAVITKTKPFNDILSALRRNPDYLFNTGHLLVGGYGYGKTTFIDYLSHYLINADILPLRITCTRCLADASGFADSFFHRLEKALLDEATKITHVDIHSLRNLEVEDKITELVALINTRKRGVIIFMDDYHKFASHFTQIFEFLGTLQVLKDTLTRKGLHAGFVVSGIPSWKDELTRNSQLAGFLDSVVIEMPDVGASLVCDVFNKRIRAYCYEGTPRLIKPDFVEMLVKEYAGKAGFRDYIVKIVTELSNNNYAIVDSPIEINEATLAAIKLNIEADGHLKSGFDKLVYGSAFKRFNQEQVAKTLELLVHIGMQGGITESDRLFASNRFYFQTLKDCGLIQKQRHNQNSMQWVLQSRFKKVVEQIYAHHRLSLHDYLLKIYAFKNYGAASRSGTRDDAELTRLRQFFGNPQLKLSTSVSEKIALGLRILETLASADVSKRRNSEDVERAFVAVKAFSEALFTLDTAALFFDRVGATEIREQWNLHPSSDEVLSEAFARYRDMQLEKTPDRLSLAFKQMREAAYFSAGTLRSLLEEQALKSEVSLLHRPLSHTEDEIAMFQLVLDGKYSTRPEDHFEYVRRVTDWLEKRFRSFFYLAGNLLFGNNYIEQCPRTIVAYAFKNVESRTVFNSVENRFEGLTRSQYRQILTEGNAFKENVVDNLALEWKADDWSLFAQLFAEFNIDTAHLQVAAFDVTQRSRYFRYCGMAEEITSAMNLMVANLIDRMVYFCATVPASKKPDDFFIKYSLKSDLRLKELPINRRFTEWPKQLSSNAVIADHVLSIDIFDRVCKRLADKMANSPDGIVVIDLMNIEYLVDHYRTSISELLNALAFISHIDLSLEVLPWMGSSILVRRKSR